MRRRTSYKLLLQKKIKSDKQIENIYLLIKDNLPEPLDKTTTYSNKKFINWCKNNQEIFLLIINHLAVVKEEYIPIILDIVKRERYKKIISKHNLTMSKCEYIRFNVLRKVLNTLKTIKQLSHEMAIDSNDDIKLNSDIKSLGLPSRTYNVLTRNNLYTIAQLKALTYEQLINTPFLGEVSITQIEQALGVKYKKDYTRQQI